MIASLHMRCCEMYSSYVYPDAARWYIDSLSYRSGTSVPRLESETTHLCAVVRSTDLALRPAGRSPGWPGLAWMDEAVHSCANLTGWRLGECFWSLDSAVLEWPRVLVPRCEAQFAVTPYIAEFFSTTTALLFVYLGLVQLLCSGHSDEVVDLAASVFVLNGASAALSHGTQVREKPEPPSSPAEAHSQCPVPRRSGVSGVRWTRLRSTSWPYSFLTPSYFSTFHL